MFANPAIVVFGALGVKMVSCTKPFCSPVCVSVLCGPGQLPKIRFSLLRRIPLHMVSTLINELMQEILILSLKHRFWILVITASVRWF